MIIRDNSISITKEQWKSLMQKIDLDKLYDDLLVEYKKKEESKKLQMRLVRKER